MLFRSDHSQDFLKRALRAAIATHRPMVLRHLLANHGERAVAAALVGGSTRVIADALSMLPPPERARVSGRLPRGLARVSSASGKLLALSGK